MMWYECKATELCGVALGDMFKSLECYFKSQSEVFDHVWSTFFFLLHYDFIKL